MARYTSMGGNLALGSRATLIALAVLLALGAACISACATVDVNVDDDSAVVKGTVDDSTVVMEVTVGPRLLDCVGVGPRKCLEVDGQFFYASIDGFDYEEGYTYRLKIERYDAFPGLPEPPQDASRYGYRLLELISKTAA